MTAGAGFTGPGLLGRTSAFQPERDGSRRGAVSDSRPSLQSLHHGLAERYGTHDEVTAQLRAWTEAYPEVARLEAIGHSTEGRELWLLTLGRDPDRRRPAVWIDGNMHASELCGTAAALRVAEDVLRLHVEPEAAEQPVEIAEALRESLVYVLPRMSPDGAEAVLGNGHFVRSVPEDDPVAKYAPKWAPRDMDGDGRCLLMRIEDPTGEFVEAPNARGMLIPRQLGDRGPFFKLYPEGVIENFDGTTIPTPSFLDAGTPDMNRNFPFQWEPEPTQVGAGSHPLSTPEARAVVEWASRHPEVYVWLNLHTFGGCFIRPLGDAPDTKLDPADLAIWRQLGEWAEELTGYPMVSGFEEFTYSPDTPIHGALSEWAWGHRGAWSHVCELWDFFVRLGLERPKRFVDYYSHLTPEHLTQLATWDAEHNHSRMLPGWAKIDHPQLGRVEVGGFDPLVGVWNPPPEELPEVTRRLSDYFLRISSLLPRVRTKATVTPVDGTVRRVDLVVENHGYLSTMGPAAAKTIPFAEPLWAEARAEGNAALSAGSVARLELGHLDGWGRGRFSGAEIFPLMRSRGSTGRAHARWHVTGKGRMQIRIGSPRVGELDVTVELD
jgi:hypothetical protein